MKIGIPKEVKTSEFRVALTPRAIRTFTEAGHETIVEKSAGNGVGITDEQYSSAGAQIAQSAAEVFEEASLIVKVKEPQESEYTLITEKHTLFCYLHLAAEPRLTEALVASGSRAIAFETVQTADGALPLLEPMSLIAGRISAQIGAAYLQKDNDGKGVLLGGVPGVRPAKTLVVGGGIVGGGAAEVALGMGSEVTVIDKNPAKLTLFHERFGGRVKTLPSYNSLINEECARSDLVVGAVLVPGLVAPKVITAEAIAAMEDGSVFTDVSIDQGGCSETSRPTSHTDPVYKTSGVTHYCVTNIPSLAARTATYALSGKIMPYALKIAGGGENEALRKGVNIENGKLLIDLGL
ncbi:MAG: alanine dehydrogenase [Candidatus Mycalebacterium zealandia]|nr:MAG: alanine dehydrogenase [Candidatus Mycalebacterium zealandia]